MLEFLRTALLEQDTSLLIRWGIPAFLCLIFMLSHGFEFHRYNREYRDFLGQSRERNAFIESLLHSARSKSFLLIVIVGGFTAALIQHDYIMDTYEAKEKASQEQVTALESQLAELKKSAQQPAEDPTDESVSLDEQSQRDLDALKQRYEQAFINYYYLKACGNASLYDELIIRAAMGDELAALGAPSDLLHSVQDTALSTYTALYTNNACDAAQIASVLEKHQNYLKALLAQFGNEAPDRHDEDPSTGN